MAKKITALILCAVTLIAASGCTAILEDEYSSVSDHQIAPTDNTAPDAIIDVGNFDELQDGILGLVKEYKDSGTFKFENYEGNIEEDVAEACLHVSYETPLGSYAVYYMTNTVNMIVSYYEAEISIIYKKTQEEVNSIVEVSAMEDAKARIKNMMDNNKDSMVISTELSDLTPEIISEYVSFLYYSNPTRAVVTPKASVSFYPEDADNNSKRIIEIVLEYPYSLETRDKMEELMNANATDIVSGLKNYGDGTALLTLTQTLAETVSVNKADELGEQNNQGISYTAYGALVEHKATSEGFAMAFKLLCDELDIECTVVNGKYDNYNHFWNIVSYGGEYYHIDVSKCTSDGIVNVFFRTDAQMSQHYWWDTENNYQCKGLVTYADIAGVEQQQ